MASTFLKVVLPLLLLLGLCPAQVQAQNLKINEFRLSGPGGAQDEFIEIYNPASVPFDATGYSVGSSSVRLTIPPGLTIPAFRCLLFTGSGYSLGNYGGMGAAAGDVTYNNDIADGSPLQLRDGAGTLVDQVSPGNLPSPPATTDEYSYVRRLDSGFPQDTDSDGDDFNLVDAQCTVGANNTTGVSNGLLRLGVPGPQNRHSLMVNNSLMTIVPASPATVRVGSGNSGTLAVRYVISNLVDGGRTVTALRLRLVAITAGTSNPANPSGGAFSGPADTRLISSTASDGTILPLKRDDPPAQPNEGGLNASASISLANLPGGGLFPGQSVTVELLFNVVQRGSYRYAVNVEVDPSPAQPDLAVRALEEDDNPAAITETDWTGVGLFSSSGSNQTLSAVTMPNLTRRFALRLTNAGEKMMAFKINLPAPPAGWTVHVFDALTGGNEITSSAIASAAMGWLTPDIAPGAHQQVRLEVTPSASASGSYEPLVTGKCSSVVDVVKVSCAVQKIAKLQWSNDGTTWSDFDSGNPPAVEQHSTLGVRAVKSVPTADWPETYALGPKWSWQGSQYSGETIWIEGKALTSPAGNILTTELGATVQGTVRVIKTPAYDVTASCSQSSVLAGAGPLALRTTTLSVVVTDNEDDSPQAGVAVRVRALTATGAATGEVGAPGTADDVVTTDAQGKAQIVWTSGTEVGEMSFEALPLGGSGSPIGAGTTLFFHTNAAYSRLEVGRWAEVGGAWSRAVTVTGWFMGQKLAGRAVSLATQIKDFDTNAPLSGWQNAAPLDAATGVTDANGVFTTVQHWNPVEAGAWPQDYDVTISNS